MAFEWKRPSDIPYPQVWFTFEAKDVDSDQNVEYLVQDMPPHLFDAAIDIMVEEFGRDEPMCASKGLLQEPAAVQDLCRVWRKCLEQKVVVGCFRKGSDEIAGLNMLAVSSKTDKKDFMVGKLEGKVSSEMFEALEYIGKQYDVYEKCNVDKYITALGLCVHPKYRKRGIGLQLLKARKNIGKAIGVNLTATVFTAEASQRLATVCGFTLVVEMPYSELAKVNERLVFKNVKSYSANLMTMPL